LAVNGGRRLGMDAKAWVADPAWLPDAYDRTLGTLEFVRVSRQELRDLPFLDKRFLDDGAERRTIELEELPPAAWTPEEPCHFIFHSARCCSTVLARALDIDGKAMCLREPRALSTLLKADDAADSADALHRPLAAILGLLGRPFTPGETVVIKPQSAGNVFLDLILEVQPRAKALFLHAPLAGFLLSIAASGQGGRAWARRLAALLARKPELAGGIGKNQVATQGDLHVAAWAWLQQQARFARLVGDQPAGRIATLDSDTLLADPAGSLAALTHHFGIELEAGAVAAIVEGPAFTRNSKRPQDDFDAAAKREQRAVARLAHGAEIDAAIAWAERAAADNGVPMRLASPLLPYDQEI
jgi:hypothetical protein